MGLLITPSGTRIPFSASPTTRPRHRKKTGHEKTAHGPSGSRSHSRELPLPEETRVVGAG